MWWERIWITIQHEFADLGNMEDITRVVVRMLVAIALGGLVGYQRESVRATAGLRTHMLVSLGSALFILIPQLAGMEIHEVSRVLQGIIAGIGFLGAGAILKQTHKNDVRGLTTAASVWMTAAIGTAAGMGSEGAAVLGAMFAIVILSVLRRVRKA